jgi:DNA polymerase III delta subunit
LPKDALVKTGAPPRGPELIRWLVGRAKAEGASVSEADARFLAQRLYPQTWATAPRNPAYDRPPDMELLRNEIAKLAIAADGGQITKTLIESLVATGDDDQIFRFIEHAAAGRVGEATVELDRLLAAGEDPAKLLAQLAQNAELAVLLDVAGRRSPEAIGADIGLSNPARMGAIARGMRGAPPGTATATVQAITDADRAMKRGELREPKDALYAAILRIAANRRAT